MADDRREEIPLAPRNDSHEEASLAPQVTSLPDRDKRRLEALLHELLRNDSVRELLSQEEDVSSQTRAGT